MAIPLSGTPRPRPWSARMAAAAALLFAFSVAAQADDYSPSLDEAQPANVRPTLVSGGGLIGIGSDLGVLPRLAAYLTFPHAWQLGMHGRIAPQLAQEPYDYLPLLGLEVRKVWMKDEDIDPIHNSEYFGVTLGNYFAYDFDGEKLGPRPFLGFAMGKYWMPLDHQPFGLDLDLGLTWLIPDITFFSGDEVWMLGGHLPGRSEQTFITLGASIFYAIP